jgi:fucose 4-O-acetylase-like acetyltransferase
MLFIISGYLFALQDHKPYIERVKKRLKTLFVPYLIWSALALILTYALESTVTGTKLVRDAGIVQIDDTRFLLHEHRWYELIIRWTLDPIPYQLWFIRVLLIYNVVYPVIRWFFSETIRRRIFFTIAILMWLGSVNLYFVEGEGLLFFSLGAWLQKSDFSIDTPNRWLNPRLWGFTFLFATVSKTIIAFEGLPFMGDVIYPVLTILYKLSSLSGLIACWYGLDQLVKWLYDRNWFRWISAFSFSIYAMHVPIVDYLTHPAMKLFISLKDSRLIAFFLLSFGVILICVLFGALLRKITPRVYSILTGGRGF